MDLPRNLSTSDSFYDSIPWTSAKDLSPGTSSVLQPEPSPVEPRITPFFNYPPDIRRPIYTTNSVESLNRSLRKIIRVRGRFPNQEAALKLLFLALR